MNTTPPVEPEFTGLLGMLKTLRTGVRSPLADLFPEPPSNKMNSKSANAMPANAKPANANAKPANANAKNASANVDAKSAKGGRKNKTRKSSKRASRKRRVH